MLKQRLRVKGHLVVQWTVGAVLNVSTPLHACIARFVQSNGNCHLSILSHGHTHTRTALQEWIFQIEGFKPYGWYLTLVQFALYSLFGGVEMATTGDWVRRSVHQAFCN